jgi:HEPN domain-containing protein
MKPTTLEWIDKAEGDFVTAQMSYRARKNPNPDAACFHAQQCAEKYLKARLEEADLAVPKTHNLYAC